MAKSTISPEVLKIIKKSVDEAVKKAADAIVRANKEFDASQRNYFKETERLLYSLPALKLKVAQDEEDLRNGLVSLPEKSRDPAHPVDAARHGFMACRQHFALVRTDRRILRAPHP